MILATGQVEGTFDNAIEGEDWQAGVVGEWVEVTELIDVSDLTEMTQALNDAAASAPFWLVTQSGKRAIRVL